MRRKRPPRAPRPGLDDKRYLENRETLKRTGSHTCGHCGEAIDMQLKYPHPLAWSCDHIYPRSTLHKDDPRHWMLSAMREAHARCNSARGAKPIIKPNPTLRTSFDW